MLTSDNINGVMVSAKYIDLQREENVLGDREQCSGLAKCTRHSMLTLVVNVQRLLVLALKVTLAARRNCAERTVSLVIESNAISTAHKLITNNISSVSCSALYFTQPVDHPSNPSVYLYVAKLHCSLRCDIRLKWHIFMITSPTLNVAIDT